MEANLQQPRCLLTGRIIVIGDVSYPAEPGIDCLTAHPTDVSVGNTSRDDAIYKEHNAVERSVAIESRVDDAYMVPWFCVDAVCPAMIGGLTTQRAAYHVAETYAVWLCVALGTATGPLPDSSPQQAIRFGLG